MSTVPKLTYASMLLLK